jgi:tetraacyldisaccharide 4'-kinase
VKVSKSLPSALLSLGWSSGSWSTRELARRGILRSEKLAARVISVGNIQAGGAGKTPLVCLIAREAISRGKSVCILIRGYGGKLEKTGCVIAALSTLANPSDVGDEAALLHERVPEAWIAVGADRVSQYRSAVKQRGQEFDLALLDDGFQHWRIQKDLEFVAVTSKRAGEVFFRDFSRQVQHADLLIWTKGEVKPACLDQSTVPWVKVKYRLSVSGEAKEKSYCLVSAIADDDFFRSSVVAAGLKVVKEVHLPDHSRFSPQLIDELTRESRNQGFQIAMTGKDWVKWRQAMPKNPGEVLVLEPELEFEQGRELWEKILWS